MSLENSAKILDSLRASLNMLVEQNVEWINGTIDITTMGRFFRARQVALDRIKVYLDAMNTGDPIYELQESISILLGESLSEIDGEESVEVLATYHTVKDFLMTIESVKNHFKKFLECTG